MMPRRQLLMPRHQERASPWWTPFSLIATSPWTQVWYVSQIEMTFGSTSIRHWSHATGSDRYLIDVNPRVLAIWVGYIHVLPKCWDHLDCFDTCKSEQNSDNGHFAEGFLTNFLERTYCFFGWNFTEICVPFDISDNAKHRESANHRFA